MFFPPIFPFWFLLLDFKLKLCYNICMKKFDRNCLRCGKLFQTTPSENQRYCNPKCSALSRIIPEKHRSFTRACLECGVTFKTYPSINKKFCSPKCCAIYYGRTRYTKTNHSKRYMREMRTDDGKRILINRYFMEQKLGRKLSRKEIVHHIDMDETNNPEDCSNYYLCKSYSTHMLVHHSISKVVKELLNIGILQFKNGEYIIAQPYLPLR